MKNLKSVIGSFIMMFVSSNAMASIDKLAWIQINNGRVLVAKSRGNGVFFIPGGKKNLNESDPEALQREILEETKVNLIPGSEVFFNEYQAPAHGKINELVNVRAYFADYLGIPSPNSEIEELKWISYEEKHLCSKVTQLIIEDLYIKGKLFTTIIFDADNTLFSFEEEKAFYQLFKKLDFYITYNDYIDFKNKNKSLWLKLRNGEINLSELGIERFKNLSIKTNLTPKSLNNLFLSALAEVGEVYDGVIDMLYELKKKYKLVLMTNGFKSLQYDRIQKFKLQDVFDHIITSEEVGKAKPNREMFEECFLRAPGLLKSNVLMVGDDYDADIVGGLNFSLATCWLNPKDKSPYKLIPNYQLKKITDLKNIL